MMNPGAPDSTTPRPRRRRVPRSVGSGAGLLALSFLVFAVFGAVWGALRPTHEGTLTEGGGVLLDGSFNVEFTGYISFVVVTGLLGVLVGVMTFLISAETRGLLMLLWVLVVALASSLAFLVVGDTVAAALHPLAEDPESLVPGARLEIVPGFSPGVGLAAAPFMAGLGYWVSTLMTPIDDPVGDAVAAVNDGPVAQV